MDHALRTVSFIADVADVLVVMVRRYNAPTSLMSSENICSRQAAVSKLCCHVFETNDVRMNLRISQYVTCITCRAIFVLELILVFVFILFWVNNFYFYIVLVQPKSIFLVFISFSCNNFSFYTIIVRPLHRMLYTEKYALHKPVMMACQQNPLQQEPTSCKQSPSVSRMRWQLLKPQYWCIICLDVLFLLFSL